MPEKKIVVGVDGSDSSKAALAWGIRQAQLTGAPLEAIMTWDYPTSYGWMIVPENVDLQADATTELEKVVKEVTEDMVGPTVEVTNPRRPGSPHAGAYERGRRRLSGRGGQSRPRGMSQACCSVR